jgi:hypothetical protein
MPCFRSAIVAILLAVAGMVPASVMAQCYLWGGRVYIGRPPRPNPLASDNGIPGTGSYAYDDYDWPSLRQALATYGLFGRRVPRGGFGAAPPLVGGCVPFAGQPIPADGNTPPFVTMPPLIGTDRSAHP